MTDHQLLAVLNGKIDSNSAEIRQVRHDLEERIDRGNKEIRDLLDAINKNVSSLDRDRIKIKAYRSFVLWLGGAVLTVVTFSNSIYTAVSNFFK